MTKSSRLNPDGTVKTKVDEMINQGQGHNSSKSWQKENRGALGQE